MALQPFSIRNSLYQGMADEANEREARQINSLNRQAAEAELQQQAKSIERNDEAEALQWVAGATDFLLQNPDRIADIGPRVVKYGQNKGWIDPSFDPSVLSQEGWTDKLQRYRDEAVAMLGGGQPQEIDKGDLVAIQGEQGPQYVTAADAIGKVPVSGANEAKPYEIERLMQIENEYRRSVGMPPIRSPLEFMRQRNQTKTPAGMRWAIGDDGTPRLEPIPGSEQETERRAQREKEEGRRREQASQAGLLVDEIQRAYERISPYAPGFLPAAGVGGAAVRQIPDWAGGKETKAGQLADIIKTITANIGFEELNKMRQNSPTGGALGNVTVQEIERLEAVAGNLDPNQPDWQFAYNLARLLNEYSRLVDGMPAYDKVAPEAAYQRLYDQPELAVDFQQKYGYLPPGFNGGI